MTVSAALIKHTCDRCGTTMEFTVEDEVLQPKHYPHNWQHVKLGQTGAEIDLCNECNDKLLVWMEEKGANNMPQATHKKMEVL